MEDLNQFIQSKIAQTLGVKTNDVNPDEEFMSLGLDSMHAIFLLDEIEKEYEVEINPHSFWEFPTINTFAENLKQQLIKSGRP